MKQIFHNSSYQNKANFINMERIKSNTTSQLIKLIDALPINKKVIMAATDSSGM